MNKYKIYTKNKNYLLKANYPKECALKFINKKNFNDEFSVYDIKKKKIYGFYHKNQFIQSGGYTNISKLNNISNNLNQKIKNRNTKYNYY